MLAGLLVQDSREINTASRWVATMGTSATYGSKAAVTCLDRLGAYMCAGHVPRKIEASEHVYVQPYGSKNVWVSERDREREREREGKQSEKDRERERESGGYSFMCLLILAMSM